MCMCILKWWTHDYCWKIYKWRYLAICVFGMLLLLTDRSRRVSHVFSYGIWLCNDKLIQTCFFGECETATIYPSQFVRAAAQRLLLLRGRRGAAASRRDNLQCLRNFCTAYERIICWNVYLHSKCFKWNDIVKVISIYLVNWIFELIAYILNIYWECFCLYICWSGCGIDLECLHD